MRHALTSCTHYSQESRRALVAPRGTDVCSGRRIGGRIPGAPRLALVSATGHLHSAASWLGPDVACRLCCTRPTRGRPSRRWIPSSRDGGVPQIGQLYFPLQPATLVRPRSPRPQDKIYRYPHPSVILLKSCSRSEEHTSELQSPC